MAPTSRRFKAVDALLLILTVLPLLCGILLKVLWPLFYTLLYNVPIDAGEEINISGALIYFTIPMPFQDLPITESQVNSWLVILSVLFGCLYLTHGIAARPVTKRQHLAEWVVEQTEKLVKTNMDPYFSGYAPFVAAIMGLSAFSSLLAVIGLFTPTSDMNVVGGWALLVFFLITYAKMKAGPIVYLKSFAQPALLTPMNVISEFATPVSMAFRHYGNVLSGAVISVLIGTLLRSVTAMLLGWLPGFLGEIPFLQIGLPAIFSVYFDLFSGCLQAFIFAMLTMLYVSGGFPAEDYALRKAKRQAKKASGAAQ